MIKKLIHGKISNVQDFHYVTLRSLPSYVSLDIFRYDTGGIFLNFLQYPALDVAMRGWTFLSIWGAIK